MECDAHAFGRARQGAGADLRKREGSPPGARRRLSGLTSPHALEHGATFRLAGLAGGIAGVALGLLLDLEQGLQFDLFGALAGGFRLVAQALFLAGGGFGGLAGLTLGRIAHA